MSLRPRHHDRLDFLARGIAPEADVVKAFDLYLAGARLRQDVARGDRRASCRQNRYETDQTKKERPPQQLGADVTPSLIEGENGALKGLHLQPSDLKVPQRHGQDLGREDI